METKLPAAAVFGDSFTFGLLQHFENKGFTSDSVNDALKIDQIYQQVFLIGKRGGTTHDLNSLYRQCQSPIKPLQSVMIDMGTNEIARDPSPNSCLLVAYRIMCFAEHLVNEQGVKQVFVAQVLPRVGLGGGITPQMFWDGMQLVNRLLLDWCDPEPSIHYWVHTGFWSKPLDPTSKDTWTYDGVHPNTPLGRALYKNSIRRALMKGRQSTIGKSHHRGNRGGKKVQAKKAKKCCMGIKVPPFGKLYK